jgi:hypothetical protein
MSEPTLKIRVDLGSELMLGRSCQVVAAELIGDGATVLDSKWGRSAQEWEATGGGWGRQRLTQWQRGFVAGVNGSTPESDVVKQLLAIIKEMAT